MSEASDVLSNLRDKAPTMPSMASAKDATDAVRSHLPSLKDVDTSVIVDRLPKTRSKKWAFGAVIIGAIATAAAVFGISRRRTSQPTTPASVYTPPLPKP
jgi:hypothetical protein